MQACTCACGRLGPSASGRPDSRRGWRWTTQPSCHPQASSSAASASRTSTVARSGCMRGCATALAGRSAPARVRSLSRRAGAASCAACCGRLAAARPSSALKSSRDVRQSCAGGEAGPRAGDWDAATGCGAAVVPCEEATPYVWPGAVACLHLRLCVFFS